jgi:hypothetical protein
MTHDEPPTDVAARVKHVLAGYDEGTSTMGETVTRLLDLITPETIDDLMRTLPVRWHEELVRTFRSCADLPPDAELFRVEGSVFTWEVEADADERSRLRKEHEARVEAEQKRFLGVTVPAIRGWLSRRR